MPSWTLCVVYDEVAFPESNLCYPPESLLASRSPYSGQTEKFTQATPSLRAKIILLCDPCPYDKRLSTQ
jgi:hypothetical protein